MLASGPPRSEVARVARLVSKSGRRCARRRSPVSGRDQAEAGRLPDGRPPKTLLRKSRRTHPKVAAQCWRLSDQADSLPPHERSRRPSRSLRSNRRGRRSRLVSREVCPPPGCRVSSGGRYPRRKYGLRPVTQSERLAATPSPLPRLPELTGAALIEES